jgi:hypothetical protein
MLCVFLFDRATKKNQNFARANIKKTVWTGTPNKKNQFSGASSDASESTLVHQQVSW